MLRAIYRRVVPFSVRQSIYRMRHTTTASPTTSSRRSRARSLYEMGRTREAAIELRDGDLYDKDLIPILYSLGNIEAAHRSYRYRKTSKLIAEAFNQPIAASKLCIRSEMKHASGFVLAEGGPGDEIRFAAIYDDLATHFDRLTITCEARLHQIMERSFPSIHFIPVRRYRAEELFGADLSDRPKVDARMRVFVNDAALEHDAELVCSVYDALGEFRQRRSDFVRPPHLIPDASLVNATRQKMGTKARPQIGICWRSMRQSEDRNSHYFTVSELAPLAAVDADYWLLQIEATEAEIDELRSFLSVCILDGLDLKDDFEGQAALIANLDAVISPLSTMAELAGSLGARTFIAAPDRSTEWRRNADGGDVWYRSARTFTAASCGGRENIMGSIARELLKGNQAASAVSSP